MLTFSENRASSLKLLCDSKKGKEVTVLLLAIRPDVVRAVINGTVADHWSLSYRNFQKKVFKLATMPAMQLAVCLGLERFTQARILPLRQKPYHPHVFFSANTYLWCFSKCKVLQIGNAGG
jgi:hypothetical protein